VVAERLAVARHACADARLETGFLGLKLRPVQNPAASGER
jgi:hypothetical protein